MKIYLLLFVILLSSIKIFGQNEFLLVDINKDLGDKPLIIPGTSITKNNFLNNNSIKTLIDSQIASLQSIDPYNKIKVFGNDALTDKAIIIIKHQFNYTKDATGVFKFVAEDATKDEIIFLYNDKHIKDNSKWSDYLLNVRNILIVFIGGKDDLQNATITVEKERSFFANSANDLVTLVGQLGGTLAPPAAPGDVPIRFAVVNPNKLNSPCNIKISHVNKEKPISIKIHEKNFFAFHVGTAAQQLNKNQIKLQNQQLTVALDSTQQKEWKSNLIAMLTFYPFGGRDIDRFEPFYKQDLKGMKFWHKAYRLTLERVGIFAGVRLSTDPIQNLYLGGSYAFSKNFNFNCGWSWANTLTPSITNVGNINSVKDALEYADRKYEKQVFFGISFAPSAIGEILGLKKEDKK